MPTPSFSSFPPSFTSFPDLEPGPSQDDEPTKKRKHAQSSSHDKKKRKSQEHSKEDRDRHREHKSKSKSKYKRRHEDGFDEKPRTHRDKPAQDLENEWSKYFYSDRRGDPLNLQYGGLHAGDVPKYHLVARGRFVLGLPHIWTVTQRTSKGIVIDLVGTRKLSGLTDSSARALLSAPPIRRLTFRETSKYDEVDGFIRVSSRSHAAHNTHELTAKNLLHPNQDAHSSSSSDDHSEGEWEDSSDDEAIKIQHTAHQEALAALDQQLGEDPSNESLWLELLDKNLSTIPINSKNATKARADVTLAIIQRARAAHQRNRLSRILLIKYLKAGEEVWESHRTKDEWERAYNIGGIELWMEWLEWRWRTSGQGVDGFTEDILRVSESLETGSHDELSKVRVFWRLAVAFQSAGFYERATAMFQSQAEITFKAPEAYSGFPRQAQLDAFEEFWDSGHPRLGETGATGWEAWVTSGKPEFKGSQSVRVAIQVHNPDPYTSWANAEAIGDVIQRVPIRSPDDQQDDSDPYGTILFGDISATLLDLKSEQAKHAFRLVWLSVLGLHIPGLSAFLSGNDFSWDDRWSSGHLSKPSFLGLLFPGETVAGHLTNDAVAGTIVGRSKVYSASFSPVRCWDKDIMEPFDVGLRDEGLGKSYNRPNGCIWGKEDVEGTDIEFVREVFRQLRLGTHDAEWDSLALAFEVVTNVKSASKASRELLKTASESALHWATHAHIERMRGRLDEARKVYNTILINSHMQDPRSRGQVWWDWAEMEWLATRDAESLAVMLRSVGVVGKGGPALLRASRLLEDVAEGIAEDEWKEREAWIKLRALLELVGTHDLNRCISVLEQHRATLRSKRPRESMTVASLMMIYRHGGVRNHALPREVLRSNVERALEEYPSNSIILGLFLEGEKGLGVWGRVRSELGESKGRVKDVSRRLQEVWIAGWEQSRWASEVERTRAGLAAAISSERTRGSAIIWYISIEFEIRVEEPRRARQLLFRAIKECPLCKELYLLAFSKLRSVFSERELHGLGEAMAERGIRLRKGLDDVWRVEDAKEDTEEDSEEGDEIEERAREIRRLMPY